MSRKVWITLCFAFISLRLAGKAEAEVRVAVVDVQRAIVGSADGKAALAALQGEADRKKKELEAKRDELKKAGEDLQRQESVLKPDVFQKKRQELEQKMMLFQQTVERTDAELQEKQVKVLQPIQQKVVAAVAQIAARDKFTLVLRADAVVWPQQTELDITNEVIRKADEMKSPHP